MSLDEKKKWKYLIYFTIMYCCLSYAKQLLIFLNIDNNIIDKLSQIILYGGIVSLIIVLYVSYYLKKKYGTPNIVILQEHQISVPFRIMLVLGIGIPIMGFIN